MTVLLQERSAMQRRVGAPLCVASGARDRGVGRQLLQHRHCERSEAIQNLSAAADWICFAALAMTESLGGSVALLFAFRIADAPSHPRGLFARALLRRLTSIERGRREDRGPGIR